MVRSMIRVWRVFACLYLNVPARRGEKTILSLRNCFCNSVQITCSRTYRSISGLSIRFHSPLYLFLNHFIPSWSLWLFRHKIRLAWILQLCSFVQSRLVSLSLFEISCAFLNQFVNFYTNTGWKFDWDCVESTDQSGENYVPTVLSLWTHEVSIHCSFVVSPRGALLLSVYRSSTSVVKVVCRYFILWYYCKEHCFLVFYFLIFSYKYIRYLAIMLNSYYF